MRAPLRAHLRVAARAGAAAALAALVPLPSAAQEPPTATDLLAHRAQIEIGDDDASHRALALPAEVLARAAPDLSDVRIVRAAGGAVPYSIVFDDEASSREVAPVESFDLTVTSARQSQAVAGGVRVSTEVYETRVPPGAWREHAELQIVTARTGFTASVRVTTADDAALELARGTIFSLPAMRASHDTIELPARTAGPVRIEIRSEPASFAGSVPPAGAAAFLAPTFRLHQRSVEPRPRTVEHALEATAHGMERGVQRIELARPPGIVPIALRIETASTTFAGDVRVEVETGDGSRREVGGGRIVRVSASDPAIAYAALVVPVRPDAVAGERMVVSIERGDSPALEAVTVVAVARQPRLVFDAYDAGLDPVLFFGGGRVRAPRYDLGPLARRLAASARPAALGAFEPNPRYHAEPALGFAMRPGAEVDRSRFAVEAPLTLGEAPEGLTRVRVSAALAAAARPDGGDVRIVGIDGRQWPYVSAGSAREAWVPLAVTSVGPAPGRDRATRYVLAPSVPNVTAEALELEVADAFFSRRAHVAARARPDVADDVGVAVAVETIARERGGGSTSTIELTPRRARALEVDVEDGDEAPLTITGARARIALVDLFVTAPAGEYLVLAGDPTLDAPSYDLARAETLLDDVPIAEASIGEVRPGALYRPPSLFERAGWEAAALYAALGLAVVVLGLLTVRLARGEDAPPPEAPAAAGRDAPPRAPTPDQERDGQGDARGDGERATSGGGNDGDDEERRADGAGAGGEDPDDRG